MHENIIFSVLKITVKFNAPKFQKFSDFEKNTFLQRAPYYVYSGNGATLDFCKSHRSMPWQAGGGMEFSCRNLNERLLGWSSFMCMAFYGGPRAMSSWASFFAATFRLYFCLFNPVSMFIFPPLLQCVDGYPYVNRCPSGLYFDDVQKFCTFKAEAKCGPLPNRKLNFKFNFR